MTKTTPPPTPERNRLRAAAALIPIVESGLNDGKLTRKFHWPAKVVILDGDLDGWRGLGGVLPKY